MFCDDLYIKKYFEQVWNKYVYSIFYSNDYIFGIPKAVYKDYLFFIKNNFKQDILFDYFYSEYEKYIKKKYKNSDVDYLNKEVFEKELFNLSMKTYTVMDDDYEEKKYICFYKRIL